MAASVHSDSVDPFVVIMVGGVVGLLLALVLLGLFYPGSGADQVGWRPTRSAEQQIQNEIDDLDQMLEAANARRRRRGQAELTEEQVHQQVNAATAEHVRRREDYLSELEIVQMLDVKNERRRAKGLPEITVEEYRARIELERGEARG
jgi:hypothetical protein